MCLVLSFKSDFSLTLGIYKKRKQKRYQKTQAKTTSNPQKKEKTFSQEELAQLNRLTKWNSTI